MHNPKQPKGDPFGVMHRLHEMPIYNRLTVLSWYSGGETLAKMLPKSKVKLYIIKYVIRSRVHCFYFDHRQQRLGKDAYEESPDRLVLRVQKFDALILRYIYLSLLCAVLKRK